jgi:hypothetical protein
MAIQPRMRRSATGQLPRHSCAAPHFGDELLSLWQSQHSTSRYATPRRTPISHCSQFCHDSDPNPTSVFNLFARIGDRTGMASGLAAIDFSKLMETE